MRLACVTCVSLHHILTKTHTHTHMCVCSKFHSQFLQCLVLHPCTTHRHTWKSPIYLPFSTFPLSFITIYYKFFLIFVACGICTRYTYYKETTTTTTRSCLSCFIYITHTESYTRRYTHGYKIIIIITTKIYAVLFLCCYYSNLLHDLT